MFIGIIAARRRGAKRFTGWLFVTKVNLTVWRCIYTDVCACRRWCILLFSLVSRRFRYPRATQRNATRGDKCQCAPAYAQSLGRPYITLNRDPKNIQRRADSRREREGGISRLRTHMPVSLTQCAVYIYRNAASLSLEMTRELAYSADVGFLFFIFLVYVKKHFFHIIILVCGNFA